MFAKRWVVRSLFPFLHNGGAVVNGYRPKCAGERRIFQNLLTRAMMRCSVAFHGPTVADATAGRGRLREDAI